jgi:hypothetical protein
MLIKFSDSGGNPFYVNPNAVASAGPKPGDRVVLTFIGIPTSVFIPGKIDEVAKQISDAMDK